MLAAGVAFLEFDGALLVAVLLGAAAVAGRVAVRHGATWDDIQRSTGEKLAAVLPALLILLSIGVLIASWVLSGTIPYLVYWGVRLVEPEHLVLTAFLSTAIMSLFTGTSWGSAGTLGVALMGTAAALDAPLAATAGAVVSGAYFGDKMSPLSDSTNICAIGAGAPLFPHIRHMLYTTTPSFGIALAVYALAARLTPVGGDGLPESARRLLADLERGFRLDWTALLPVAVVVWAIVRRTPPTLAILLSSTVAVGLGTTLQPFGVEQALAAVVAGFRAEMMGAAGVDPASLGADFLRLVERGGLYSMATTLIVVIAAFLLAAAMDVSGALGLLIGRLQASVRSVFGLIAATMASGATMIALTSHGGVTGLVIGGLFQQAYRERGLAPQNLSRSLEDSVTITEPLMPWTVSASFMAATLGVATLDYAPWAVFCYGGPCFSLLIAALYRRTGFGIRRERPETTPG
jgi:NhaC family Na+:H+ antiporter